MLSGQFKLFPFPMDFGNTPGCVWMAPAIQESLLKYYKVEWHNAMIL